MTTEAPDERTLAYHHPDNPQFSLVHVTGDEGQHEQQVRQFDADETLEIRPLQDRVDDSDAYLIYASDAPAEPFADFETEAELVEWIRTTFSPDDLQIVLAVYRAFRGVLKERDADDGLELYKRMELEEIPGIVNGIEWRQSVPEVGAELLSEFVLVHPMPNTNHRTGISLLDRYLTSMDPSFSMPDTGIDGEWYTWARDYIHDSKRLLTLRNRLALFQYAVPLGYDTVERKEGLRIDLAEIDFGETDSATFERQHRQRTREFVRTLLDEAGATHLEDVEDDGKEAFVARLRAET